MIVCGEGMARVYESMGLKVDRPEQNMRLWDKIPDTLIDEIFKPTGGRMSAEMTEKTYKAFSKMIEDKMGKKKGGKRC